MPSLWVKDFVKDFVKDLGKVFAVRLTRPAKNRRTQPSSTTTHHGGDHSILVDIPVHPGSLARDPGLEVPANISSVTSPRGASFARGASDMAQTFLPIVQAVAGPIPVAGTPLKAAIGGVLEIFKVMDRRGQNKVDLDSLASTLDRLRHDLYNAPRAQDDLERSRRETLISMLLETSATLTELRKRSLAYPSVTQDIAGCFTKIDRYMAEYLWSCQMQSGDAIRAILATVERQQEILMRIESVFLPRQSSVGPSVTLSFVTLVDVTGRSHPIPMDVCDSFERFNEMLQVLFKRDTIEARLQRRYMEQGQYDLIIDDDKQVTRLTSHEWQSIEAGTTIVMRVVFEQETSSRVDYRCHLCGAVNDVGAGPIMDSLQRQAGCSINCRVCKRRFQISRGSSSAKRSTQSPNIDSLPRTEAEMRLIRNFHIQQTKESKEWSWEESEEKWSFRPVNKEARDFSAHGASATTYSHGHQFLGDGPTISPQPGDVLPSQDEYGYNRIVEIEEDGNDDYDEDGTQDSDDAFPADDGEDHEEWNDCEDGEDHEETNFYDEL